MRYLRGVIIAVIILVIVFFIGSTLRSYYLFLKEPVTPVYDALPQNTSIIIRTKSVVKLLNAINNSAVIDLFPLNSQYHLISAYVDSIQDESKFSAFVTKSEAIFAFTGEESSNFLIGISIGKVRFNNINGAINDLVKRRGYNIVKDESGVYKITAPKGSAWYYIRNGVFMISSDSTAILNSLSALTSKNKLNNDQSLNKLLQSTGKSSIGNILINNQLWSRSIWPEKATQLSYGTPFDSWSSFDIIIKKGEVALGGFTYTPSNHVFKGQNPVEFDQLKYFPSNTSFSISVSLSDQFLYTAQYLKKDTIHVKGYDAAIKQESLEIFKPSQHLNSWVGSTVSLVCTKNYFKGSNSEKLVMVSCRNKDSAAFYLKPYIEPINDSLGKMHYTNLTSDLWGPVFTMPDNLYCLISSEYIAFSPSRNLLSELSYSRIRSKELLNVEETTGRSNNIFIYLKPESIANWIFRKNKNSGADFINFLAKNRSIGIEYSANEDMQYTHAWMMLTPKRSLSLANKSSNTGTDKVDDPVASEQEVKPKNDPVDKEFSVQIKLPDGNYPPIIVNGRKKSEKRIAVLTKKGLLSVYDHAGNHLWSYNCKENAFNKVLEADFYKNGSNHYIICTAKKLHIIDYNGKEIKDSPILLPGEMAGGISLFDYDQKSDYRLLYVGRDSRIYNITLKGKELPDWQKPKVKGTGEITFHRSGGKDFLVYHYKEEVIKFYDRRGKERIKVDEQFKVSPSSNIHNNKTNSKGLFLTVTSAGEMVYLNENGIISKSSFGRFGTNTWFNYFDFNSDGSMDFIFAKNNRIVAYSKMKMVIGECLLKEGSFGKPFIYSSSANENWIFARNNKTGEILAFNNRKRMYPVSITSDTDPIVYNPGGSLKEILVAVKGQKLILTELSDL